MHRLSLGLLFVMVLASVRPASAQELIVITAPVPGQAVQGVVAVTGTSEVPGFESAEISFAYADDPTGTWFFVSHSQTSVLGGTLAAWDTTSITDGNYNLRLRVFLADGKTLETTVTGLQVRNYTPAETPTPGAAEPVSPQPLLLSTPTDLPQPTPLPPNPAAVTPASAYQAMARGALVILFLFAFLGLLIRLRRR